MITSRDLASTISLSNLFHPSNLLCLPPRKGYKSVLLLARAHMSKPGSFGAGEEQPHAVICPSNLFRRGGEDALLQPEGLCRQRLPQLVSAQAGLELRGQEAMSSDGGTWPCTPQPTCPHLVHGLLRPLGVAAVRLRHVAHGQRHRLERVIAARQSGVSRCCCTRGSSPLLMSPQT